MGNFYTNFTLQGPAQSVVAAALAGRSAMVTPEQKGCVVVFDEESDQQDREVIAELAACLSRKFACPLLVVMNHDDDILWYQLYLSGELVDDYDSSPAYFVSDSEEVAAPAGGNAKKLCEVFGVNHQTEVEEVLRKPAGAEDGYVFAFERHADLVSYLGISPFGVGTGFRQIESGELPEELNQKDLIATKELASDAAQPLFDYAAVKPMPGYYKVSFRAHPALKQSIPTGWMPGIWDELKCTSQDLSANFLQATAAVREILGRLGFTEEGFKKLKRVLNPSYRDGGGINYLGGAQAHFGQLFYNRFYYANLKAEKESVFVSFTAIFENDILSCTNNTQTLVDSLPNHQVIRLKSDDVVFIYQHFLEVLKGRQDRPRPFQDSHSLRTWFDANAVALFEDKVRRGIWVRMSDYEVELAQRKLSVVG